ncbi:MAG: ribosome silencing factor [Lachnospirales bacterium]
MSDNKEMIKIIYDTLEDKFGEDIRIINIDSISNICEYFVVVNGNSTTHVKSLAMNVEEKLKDAGYLPYNIEGIRGNSWILMDYSNVVIHVFDKENRDFYNIERLWSDGIDVNIKDM